MLADHKRGSAPSKGLPLQNYKEKESYLAYEVCLPIYCLWKFKTSSYFCLFQLKRYKIYSNILNARVLAEQAELQNCILTDEETSPPISQPQSYQPLTVNLSSSNNDTIQLQQPKLTSHQQQPSLNTNRYSYRAAIYRSEAQQDFGWQVLGILSACVV